MSVETDASAAATRRPNQEEAQREAMKQWLAAAAAHTVALAKTVPILATVNRVVKARALRRGLKKLARHYGRMAAARDYRYCEESAVEECIARIRHLKEVTGSRPTEKLNLFWVGANRDQDESGFLQALRTFGTVHEFVNQVGGYGQWFWDSRGRVREAHSEILSINDENLLLQVRTAQAEAPLDLLMGQMWASYISPTALASVRALGVPVLNVSMDDRLPRNWEWKQGARLGAIGLAPIVDLTLSTSPEVCGWYGLEGGRAIFWPLASDPALFSSSVEAARDIDVLFVGNRYGVREAIVRGLKRRGVTVTCFGSGWPNGAASAEESVALYKRAKIVLGIGTVGHCTDVLTLKLRDFDAPMSGALYLTHRNPDLKGLFTEGAEIECYETVAECARKITFYLRDQVARKRVASAGQARALKEHSWVGRLEETLRRLHFLGEAVAAAGGMVACGSGFGSQEVSTSEAPSPAPASSPLPEERSQRC